MTTTQKDDKAKQTKPKGERQPENVAMYCQNPALYEACTGEAYPQAQSGEQELPEEHHHVAVYMINGELVKARSYEEACRIQSPTPAKPFTGAQLKTLATKGEAIRRSYDDAMVEDLAATYAKALTRLDHADKLAEALREALHKLDMHGRLDCDHAATDDMRSALAKWEGVQG